MATVILLQMVSSFAYSINILISSSVFRSGFQKQGATRHETTDRIYSSILPKQHTDQKSLIQQAHVDDYLLFLERRYERLNDDGTTSAGNPSFTWKWLLEANQSNDDEREKGIIQMHCTFWGEPI